MPRALAPLEPDPLPLPPIDDSDQDNASPPDATIYDPAISEAADMLDDEDGGPTAFDLPASFYVDMTQGQQHLPDTEPDTEPDALCLNVGQLSLFDDSSKTAMDDSDGLTIGDPFVGIEPVVAFACDDGTEGTSDRAYGVIFDAAFPALGPDDDDDGPAAMDALDIG